MDASMAFPCFDQPDLKARFTLDLQHPATWSVIGNTAPISASETHSQFAETRPISTYLFAFAAGPFAAVRSKNSAEPTIYVRKSQLARAQQEAPAGAADGRPRHRLPIRLLLPAVSLPQVRSRPHSRLPVRRHGARRRDLSQRRRRPLSLDADRERLLPPQHPRPSRDLPPMVRRPRHHALVRRPLAQGRLRAVHGLQSPGAIRARLEPMEALLRRHQAAGLRDRRDPGHHPHLPESRQPEGRQIGLRSDRLPEGPRRPKAA